MRTIVIITFFVLLGLRSQGQTDGLPPVVTRAVVVGSDTIPFVSLPVFELITAADPHRAENLKRYLKLRRDVLKAYPYAKLAAQTLKQINDSIALLPTERARNKFIKEKEKVMKARFEKDLKKLTFTQGTILIKLVDRETGTTSYELVKELRGSFQAFFWQSLARIFGATLKSEYDAEGDDAAIESIVKSIEKGEIQVVKL
ncbi:MAG: DUF4294 domain-containing protein [Bacteroidota bacterium]